MRWITYAEETEIISWVSAFLNSFANIIGCDSYFTFSLQTSTILPEFLTEGGQKCLMLSSAQECTKINDRKTFQWEHFTNSPKNACMIQQDFNQCLVSKFYQCSGASRAAAIIFNEFIDILFNKAYCSSITNEGGTKLRNNDAIVLSFCLLIFIYNYRYFIL